MSSALETDLGKDCVDVEFPEASCFRMALEGTLDGQDLVAGKTHAEAGVVPLNEGFIKAKKGRDRGARRVSESVASITTENNEVVGSSESKEQTKDWVLETGSECLHVGM